jgi:xylulokinase
VSVPSPGEYVALGAARQAAWVLGRSRDTADEAPGWSVAADEVPESGGDWAAEVREAYTRLRRQMHGI